MTDKAEHFHDCEWYYEDETKPCNCRVRRLEATIASQAAEIAALKAAIRAAFDQHGSAPTDCDCSKCTRLAVLLDYLPGEHNHD
jgi:hypothetical protein